MRRHPRPRGFTLVELLVVISIIGTLISILLPSISYAMEYSRRTKCAANMHSIYTAILTYANDPANDQKFPHAVYDPEKPWTQVGFNADADSETDKANNQDNLRGLYMLIRRQLAIPEIFICPSTTDAPVKDASTYYDFPERTNVSYSYQNQWAFTTTLADREDMAILADRNPLISDAGGQVATIPDDRKVDKTVLESANSPNHDGQGQNVLYRGGNVKFTGTPKCGVTIKGVTDNIYTMFDSAETPAPWGKPMSLPDMGTKGAYDRTDSFLVP